LNPLKRSSHNPLFTKEELAVLSPGVIDRAKLKSQAKKAKKRQMAQAKTEGELMYGMMGMDVVPQEPVEIPGEARISARQLRKEKKKAREARDKQAAKAQPSAGGMELDADAEMDQKKEADFAAFLANVGGEFDLVYSIGDNGTDK
jgi:nuclear GTP-binding protein